jgi:purine-binding chemotaxis protein CheW
MQNGTTTNGIAPFILFVLNEATYAIRSRDIQQLDMLRAITAVPNAPPFVQGVVSVRGEVIPVINLRKRFGFADAPASPRSRMLVVRHGKRTVGLLVDSAREFASITENDIQPPPETIADLSGRYLEGIAHVGDRLVLVIDVTELLNSKSLDLNADAPAGARS